MAIAPIANTESGLAVRTKLNEAIAAANLQYRSLIPDIACDGSVSASTGEDATEAINDMLASAGLGQTITLPNRGNCIARITDTIRKPIGVNFDFNGVTLAMDTTMDGKSGFWGGNNAISSDKHMLKGVNIQRIGGYNAWPLGGAGGQATVTITIATPGVITWTAHGMPAGLEILLATTGVLPTGLTQGTTYYVAASPAPTADTFSVSATVGGSAINTSGSQSGVHTAITSINDCCLKLEDPQKCIIDIAFLRGKTNGLCLPKGSQYNTWTIGQIISCKYHMNFHSHAYSNNQNTFIGGSYRTNSNENLTQDVFGVYFDYIADGYQSASNNVWLNPSFELQYIGVTGDRIPYYFNAGRSNLVIGMRHEANTGDVAWFSGAASRNVIDVSFVDINSGELRMTDTSTAGDNILKSDGSYWAGDRMPGWSSGKLVDFCHSYNNTTLTMMPPFTFLVNADNAYTNTRSVPLGSGTGFVIPRYGYLELGYQTAVAVHIDTSHQKSFKIFDDYEASFRPYMGVNCYDQYGVMIPPEANFPVRSATVTGEGDTFMGGSTISGINPNAPRAFTVSDATKMVRLYFTGQTGGTLGKLRGFSIFPMEAHKGQPAIVHGPPEVGGVTGVKFSSTIPAIHGKFALGERVQYIAATGGTGTLSEWLVTTGGWLAPARVNATAYVANQLMSEGANIYMCHTAGTSGTGTAPTGTTRGTGYTDGTVVWRYIGAKAVLVAVNFP